MSLFIEVLETIMKYIVEISTVCLEMAGIIVLVSSAVICFVKFLTLLWGSRLLLSLKWAERFFEPLWSASGESS